MSSRRIALCGLLTALAVVVMILAGAMGLGTYAGPVLAMVALLPVLEEYGIKSAVCTYIAAALLGLLLVPEPELAWVYTAFGWYPLLRPQLERISSRLLRSLLKLALGAGLLLLLYGVVLRLLGLTADLQEAAPLLNAALLVMGTLTFLLTDVALGRMSFLWRTKFRKKFLPR